MDTNRMRELIKEQEGYSKEVYLDTKEIATVGFGHTLYIGSKVTRMVADLLFNQDFANAMEDYNRFSRLTGIKLCSVRKAVMVNLFFNIGYRRAMGFNKMIKAMARKDFVKASEELVDSRWARGELEDWDENDPWANGHVSFDRSNTLRLMMRDGGDY